MQSSAIAAASGMGRLTYVLTHVAGITLVLCCLALLAQSTGLDLALAQVFYDPAAREFPLHDSRLLELLGHRIVLVLPVAVGFVALAAALASYRVAALRAWRGPAWAVALTCAVGQVCIGQLKHYTALPRPYDLAMFGGYAQYPAQFWAASRAQAGGALPSGHAGAGYSMLTLYFAGWALGRRAWRWAGLAAGAGAGLLFSAVRIAQGAHFLSQTLWSAALMWLLCSLFFYPAIAGPAGEGLA